MASHPRRSPGDDAGVPYNARVRRVPFHRSLSLMAVVAMLLIVLAPVLSRWMAHGTATAHPAPVHAQEDPGAAAAQGPHHHGGHPAHGMAMAGSHSHHAMADDLAGHLPSTPADQDPVDPHADHEMGVDCDYCLIAARMVSLLAVLLIGLIAWRPSRCAFVWMLPHGAFVGAGHLGARGPPPPA